MEALQAVADVEWGMSSDRFLSPDANAYVEMRRRVQPFRYFWKTNPDLINLFVRESSAYRSAVEAGATPDEALHKLKSNKEFMARLRAEKTRLQAGFVAIDPLTGQIKAWVGSRDFKTDQFDHVAQARRQPGSTFKMFVYGAALEQGMSPDKRFTDRSVEIQLPDGTVWRPADGSPPTGKRMTAREGLIYSKNTITAQVMQEVGARKTAVLARAMGVNRSKLDEVPSLALGTSPVTPLEIVSAYSTLAGIGEYRQPIYITRITDKKGRVLAQFTNETQQVMTERTVGHLINMLRGAVDQGTGKPVRAQFGLRADVAGKTGTTQKNTDGWFVLMHPRLVAGAWIGFNDSRVSMRSNYWGEGAHNALLVVGDFFQHGFAARLIDARAEFPFAKPQDSIWEPLFDAAKEWFGGIFKDWLFGEIAKPSRRNLQAEVRSEPPQRQQPSLTTEQLQDALRERKEQIRQENRDRE
jgi:penicillin-binding protein 1A